MAKYKIKRFTRWDQTDQLKASKDSDILAAQAKPLVDARGIALDAATGAAALGSLGAVSGFLGGASGKMAHPISKALPSGLKNAKGAGIAGAVVGTGLGAGISYLKGRKQSQDNAFYNKRLNQAKKYALRRERKDWRTNMTQRDGYSY